MNYRALALCLLLALPVGLVAMPIHNVQALTTPEMFVVPIITEFDGPCVKGTTFAVDVWLFNMKMIAAGDVYAFDFNLDWSSIVDGCFPLVALVNNSIAIHSPWPSGGYFVVDNATYSTTYPESGPKPNQASNNETNYPQFLITGYHLAITAMPPKGTGLWDVNQSVLTLTFRVEKDVCWPYGYDFGTGGFRLTLNSISGDGTTVIPLTPITQNGEYSQIPFQPNIDLVDKDAVVNSTMALVTEKCVSHETDVEVDLTNITSVYGFGFKMTFPYISCLEPDLQKITIKAAFPPPYEVLSVTNGTCSCALGWVQVIVIRPSEKPTVCGADVPAVDVVFHTIDIVDVPPQLPSESVDPIHIDWAFVLAKGCACGIPFEYDYGTPTVPCGYAGNTIWSNPTGVPFDCVNSNTLGLIYGLYSWTADSTDSGVCTPLPWSNGWLYYSPTYTLQYNDITYYFKPSKYDLNLDCVVDVQDMKMLVPYYGKTTYPGGYGDIFNDDAHLVDIYDFVAMAKHVGPIDP